jgi:Cof subfamily protein (haloacid dehalogenase superfamily)
VIPSSIDPGRVRAVAMDLDRTILGPSLELTERLISGVKAVKRSGVEPIVATGRMLRSALPYARQIGVTAPVICYQGALIADPADGSWMLHRPVPVALAHEVLRELARTDEHVNLYVDDELYVAQVDEEARAYASHGRLQPHAVGDLVAWLDEPTTKIVVVGESGRMDRLEESLRDRFGGRLFIAKSLPTFLEVAEPDVSKGSGLHWVCEHLGIEPDNVVAFGDGQNDLELLEEAGHGGAVEDAEEKLLAIADFTVPSVVNDGVANFLHALAAARGVDSDAG